MSFIYTTSPSEVTDRSDRKPTILSCVRKIIPLSTVGTAYKLRATTYQSVCNRARDMVIWCRDSAAGVAVNELRSTSRYGLCESRAKDRDRKLLAYANWSVSWSSWMIVKSISKFLWIGANQASAINLTTPPRWTSLISCPWLLE